MLTKAQLRAACRKIPNVVQFCTDYDLPRRTVMRMRTMYASPSRRTIERIEAALFMEGLVSGDKPTNRAKAPGRKPGRVGRRNT